MAEGEGVTLDCRCRTDAGYWVAGHPRDLTPDEQRWATDIGMKRYGNGVRMRLPQRGADLSGPEWHVKGAHGELALAILLGVPWPARWRYEDRLLPDIDPDIEVKTCMWARPALYARERDLADHPGRRYVLVSRPGDEGSYHVLGWAWTSELRAAPLADPGQRGKPVHLLRPDDIHRLPFGLRHQRSAA